MFLGHVDLTLVHEFDGGLQFRPFNVSHYHDWMLARVLEEERLKIGAARGQHHFMGFDGVAIAGQCHVDEGLALQELIEDVGQIRLVVVPAEAELLR